MTPTTVLPVSLAFTGKYARTVRDAFNHAGIVNTETIIIYQQSFGKTPYMWRDPKSGELVRVNAGTLLSKSFSMVEHLAMLNVTLDTMVPHDFRGNVCIDVERIQLGWSLQTQQPDQAETIIADANAALLYEPAVADPEAIKRWEPAAHAFITESMRRCVARRPFARWGWYDLPRQLHGSGRRVPWHALAMPEIYASRWNGENTPEGLFAKSTRALDAAIGTMPLSERWPLVWPDGIVGLNGSDDANPDAKLARDLFAAAVIPCMRAAHGVTVWGDFTDKAVADRWIEKLIPAVIAPVLLKRDPAGAAPAPSLPVTTKPSTPAAPVKASNA